MGQGSPQDQDGELREDFSEIKLRLTLEGWIRAYRVKKKEKRIPFCHYHHLPGAPPLYLLTILSHTELLTLSWSEFAYTVPALEALLHPYPLAQVLVILQSPWEIPFSITALSQSGCGGDPKWGLLYLPQHWVFMTATTFIFFASSTEPWTWTLCDSSLSVVFAELRAWLGMLGDCWATIN